MINPCSVSCVCIALSLNTGSCHAGLELYYSWRAKPSGSCSEQSIINHISSKHHISNRSIVQECIALFFVLKYVRVTCLLSVQQHPHKFTAMIHLQLSLYSRIISRRTCLVFSFLHPHTHGRVPF